MEALFSEHVEDPGLVLEPVQEFLKRGRQARLRRLQTAESVNREIRGRTRLKIDEASTA